jgi:predicted house-cleaning noncanonical NTP pyrophosphatase (MazG superfamily)
MSELTPAGIAGYPIKVIRDRMPDIIADDGVLFYDHVSVEQRTPWLRRKLIEEAAEYVESREVDELADVLAVVEGLAATHGLTLAELTERAAADPRGGFLTGRMMRGYHADFDGQER